MGFNCLKARATSRRQFNLLPLGSQKFLVLTSSTSEGRKAESTLEPPSGFEHGTPGHTGIHGNPAPYPLGHCSLIPMAP